VLVPYFRPHVREEIHVDERYTLEQCEPRPDWAVPEPGSLSKAAIGPPPWSGDVIARDWRPGCYPRARNSQNREPARGEMRV
jgi:hypothetical protein